MIGGVGDKQYYNDVWVLDTINSLWIRLDVHGQQPQGRFSHTAIVANSDIAIYGGYVFMILEYGFNFKFVTCVYNQA